MTDGSDRNAQRLSAGETADLSAVLSTLVKSGYPIEAGLEAAARELRRGRLARSLGGLARQLREGASLEEAIAAQGRHLPDYVQALVIAGLRTGRLAEVLEELVAIQRRTAEIRRTVAINLAYPSILLAIVVGVVALYGLAVVPSLGALYDDFDVEVPLQSQLLLSFSGSGLAVLLSIVAVVVGGWLLAALASEMAEVRSMMNAVPLLGPISRWMSLTRFSRLMALTIENELPLPSALTLAARGSHDADLAGAGLTASRRIERGQSLGEAMRGLPPFPKSLGPMVEWGQQAGSLPDAFRTTAEMFEGRIEAQLSLVRTVLPPLAFLVVVWVVSFLLSSIIVPLISLIEKLS